MSHGRGPAAEASNFAEVLPSCGECMGFPVAGLVRLCFRMLPKMGSPLDWRGGFSVLL